MARTLEIIPILHTAQDLGSLAEVARRRTLETGGPEAWDRKQRALHEFWDRIETHARATPIPDAGLFVYQDGLPVCGHEQRIVDELAAKGSRNHMLLQHMISHGATVMGTESADLLLKEIELQASPADHRAATRARANLELRDRFIAKRINDSLPAGASALLFIGALHDVRPGLARDIIVHTHRTLPHASPR